MVVFQSYWLARICLIAGARPSMTTPVRLGICWPPRHRCRAAPSSAGASGASVLLQVLDGAICPTGGRSGLAAIIQSSYRRASSAAASSMLDRHLGSGRTLGMSAKTVEKAHGHQHDL
ncbi:hypothetical protein ABID25_000585 [Mesorhizobium abyssinicae]